MIIYNTLNLLYKKKIYYIVEYIYNTVFIFMSNIKITVYIKNIGISNVKNKKGTFELSLHTIFIF